MNQGKALIKSAVTIAGSDSSGGAGIQADIKTMMAQGVYAQSVITALTAQNTQGVTDVLDVAPDFVREQLDAVFADIRPDAVKVGMVSDAGVACVIGQGLRKYGAERVVVDPVMVATSGAALSSDASVLAVVDELFGCACLVTPNLAEARVLWGIACERGVSGGHRCPSEISTPAQMLQAARAIQGLGASSVLVKGGHLTGDALDILLMSDGGVVELRSRRVETNNTHGTGCTLSSAIASQLALGRDLVDAVRAAKDYLTGALEHDPCLGKGSGPLNHAWALQVRI